MRMSEASLHIVIDPPWTSLDPVRVGTVPKGLGTPTVYALASIDGQPSLRVDVYDPDGASHPFADAKLWNGYLVIGHGQAIYLVHLTDRQSITIELDAYFGYLYPTDSDLLITSAEKIRCINSSGRVRWTSEVLGIDGVIVTEIVDGTIYAEGEWDPPGGWRPFQLDLATGERIQ